MPRFLGRRVAALQKRTTDVSYTYDANSTRATKTVNGVKYTYQYLGGKLVHETRGEKSFHYYYDANGCLTAIKYRLTPTGQDYAYYATHNWRGDVVGLYNGDGDLKAKYEYDTWGKVISVKDANGTRITDQNHVGNLNPFRYRGYYYDTETGLYYLMTRYYDPVTHRFLNADGYFQSGDDLLSTNMFAYCGNNPVSNIDPNGTCYIKGKWMVMGHVPGADYYCYKCGGCDPAVYPNAPKGSSSKPNKNTSTNTSSGGNSSQGNGASQALGNTANAATLITGTVFEAGGVVGMSTGSSLAASAYLKFLTVPMSVAGHCLNPNLTDLQKGILISYDFLNPAVGVLISLALVNIWNPAGWAGMLAIAGVATAFTVGCMYAGNKLESDFIAYNKQNGW